MLCMYLRGLPVWLALLTDQKAVQWSDGDRCPSIITLAGYPNPREPDQLEVTPWLAKELSVAAGGGGLVLELTFVHDHYDEHGNNEEGDVTPCAPPKLSGVSGGPAFLPNGKVRVGMVGKEMDDMTKG